LVHHLEADQKVDIPEGVSLPLENSLAHCRFLGKLGVSRSGQLPLVAVEMGVPSIDRENADYGEVQAFVAEKALALQMPELKKDWSLVTISNRHLVFHLDKVNRDLIRQIGPALQQSHLWDGINVHIVAPKNVSEADRRQSAQILSSPLEEVFEVFVWERGAGETQACGSGASAIGAAAFASGLCDRRQWLGIDMPGGRLYIKQEQTEDTVTLAGPGQMVFRGKVSV
jgi:diaminopimelate epimerase